MQAAAARADAHAASLQLRAALSALHDVAELVKCVMRSIQIGVEACTLPALEEAALPSQKSSTHADLAALWSPKRLAAFTLVLVRLSTGAE